MTPRILRSEGGNVERLQVFVAGGKALDLFWLEMVFKGSRLPYCIEAVADAPTAVQYLVQRAAPDLILVEGTELAEKLPSRKPLFVLADAAERERCADPIRFIEKPFTHDKLFDCLAKADLSAWAARVVPV